METANTSLFSLTIDPVTKAHLTETAKWAKFLAVIGFVFLGLALIGGIIGIASMSYLSSTAGSPDFGPFYSMGVGFAAFMFIIVVLIAFFPLMFLLRFSNQMKSALASNDQQKVNTSFQNLKAYFRYLGIVTIIFLAFYAIAFMFGIFGSVMRY